MTVTTGNHDQVISHAHDYLARTGLRVLDRSWQSPDGQLDIAAADWHTFVVCDVKTWPRSGNRTPLETVSQARISRLRRLAVAWLNAHGTRFEQIRIDVVGVTFDGTGGTTIEHVKEVG
jgi:putative endonuclease